MHLSHRPLASLGILTAAATAAIGLMLSPTATADTPDGPGAATTAAAGSLHAWRGEPVGDPDKVFEGFDCQPTDYRYSSWQVVSDGPPELWMGFNDPECQDPSGFFEPGEPQQRNGVGSVQRFR